MRNRGSCENYDRCGASGHYFVEGRPVRCPCLVREINQRALGVMFDKDPKLNSSLLKQRGSDLLITLSLVKARPHIAGALLKQLEEGKTFQVLDAYRLIEIFLEKDEELTSQAPVVDADLLVLLIGFGDPRNRYLPELMSQVLARRQLQRKPTWVLSQLDNAGIGQKYSEEFRRQVSSFKPLKDRA